MFLLFHIKYTRVVRFVMSLCNEQYFKSICELNITPLQSIFCGLRYIIQPLHNKLTSSLPNERVLCKHLYSSSNFFNILNLFPNQFYSSCQRLALLKCLSTTFLRTHANWRFSYLLDQYFYAGVTTISPVFHDPDNEHTVETTVFIFMLILLIYLFIFA